MKKVLFAIICLFCVCGARAANENAATSKEYVDTELATKQPTIPAAGDNVVMTFDSNATDGIGTKNIYDPSGDYASQTDALVTAATANAAVQMAINGEFYCKEWSTIVENDCWLWGIKSELHNSPNLLCTVSAREIASFDPQTSIMSNTYTDTRDHVQLCLFHSNGIVVAGSGIGCIDLLDAGQTKHYHFTSANDSDHIQIKHNGKARDFRLWFPVEPSTEYTFVAKALSVDPTTIGGMQVQIMLVPGNYTGDEIIPCGQNIYIPQNQQ